MLRRSGGVANVLALPIGVRVREIANELFIDLDNDSRALFENGCCSRLSEYNVYEYVS